jgi:hypothetical protein
MGDVFAGQGYGITRFGISAHAWCAEMQRKTAETPNFDAITTCQGSAHMLEHRFDRQFYIQVGKVFLPLSQEVNQFGFCHLSLAISLTDLFPVTHLKREPAESRLPGYQSAFLFQLLLQQIAQ